MYVTKIVCNRINSDGLEQFLVVWAGKYKRHSVPLSWHSINELSSCLELVQEYLDNKTRSASDSSRSLTVTEPTSRDIDVYNGVLEVKDGFIKIKACTDAGVDTINSDDVPTPAMLSRARSSATSTAEDRIRMEVVRRLRGLPGPPIILLNKIDRSSPPLKFQFITQSILREGVEKADPATMTGCQKCRPHMGQNIGCEYTKKCDCLEYAAIDVKRLNDITKPIYDRYIAGKDVDLSQLPKRFPYFSNGDNTGCLVPFYLNERHPIYECNKYCMCGPGCKNRIVQHGRQVDLVIFKTKDRGWGLKSTQGLRQGQFIDTYRGEIITDAEATRREKATSSSLNSYLYSLDKFAEENELKPEELYVVDGEYFGGPTRFMNHSCEPNCRQYTVSYNKHDVRVYEIAFFAYRNIEPSEELTFDYLDKDEEEEEEGAPPPSQEKPEVALDVN
ncbi:hypothetical protein H2199_001550 [Coniosporium tulheliwenetii]|uniref:Uncharacterized protein n=1 Tax=Coniosporium tulheliwenetii TaxID=3383036 RepID=A0ACC2ZJN6_9PEZI|nr:hypothetical protein H2199_001550 [Cladosporium sp. JES 115]